MVALAVFDPSAILVAVTVTTPAEAGAVKVTGIPDVLFVGKKVPPPLEDQVTPRFKVSLVSVAASVVSCCPIVKPPRRGDTLTLIFDPPEVRVVAVASFENGLRFPAASVAST